MADDLDEEASAGTAAAADAMAAQISEKLFADDGLARPAPDKPVVSDIARGLDRTLVLGGGGEYYVAWYCGFLHGLYEQKVNLDIAEMVVGTSAGAYAGSTLTSGHFKHLLHVFDFFGEFPRLFAKLAPVTSPNLAKLPPPQTTVDDAIRALARSDMEQPPNLGNMQLAPPAVNLLSDPMNVDFRPYLARILALVRRNWLSVIPSSARLGNRGMVTVQFIVDRSGQVPKLVIETPSGSEALDRAAVAGISASVPFPPLPAEFKGSEIRLQFAFKYNIK